MPQNIENLQQLADIYRNASKNNQHKAEEHRQEAQKLADIAKKQQNLQGRNTCMVQQEKNENMATELEQIAAKQLEYARICEKSFKELEARKEKNISDLQELLYKIKVSLNPQCSNQACKEILDLIEKCSLKESPIYYENYLKCCGDHRN
jgi:hypothetical protein